MKRAYNNNNGTRSFIYADDLCVTAQQPSFVEVETTIEESLSELTHYYKSNNLRANTEKNQVTAFHLGNKEAKRTLKVKWNRTYLENTHHPKYLGVTLDRTLSYKQHIHNTKMKVATRNTLIGKLSSSKWGTNASTIRTTTLALGYSVTEYAATAITGCLKPTNVEELYLLSGIAPPSIRRDVCTRVEKAKQETKEAHSLHGQIPTERRLTSRNCFLHSVKPANFPPKVIRCSEWLRRTNHGQRGGVSTAYVQVTHAARSSGRNGNTSMETQHVYAVSRQKIPRICCNTPSLHDPAPWMTF